MSPQKVPSSNGVGCGDDTAFLLLTVLGFLGLEVGIFSKTKMFSSYFFSL